jgi:peptidoglycan hydrolase-like protein with peptidoglycan-binding domain
MLEELKKQLNQLAQEYKAIKTTIAKPMAAAKTISAAVGKGGANVPADVKLVQQLLNAKNNAGLTEDGAIGPATVNAIAAFQKKIFNGWADGKIDVGGSTWKNLSGGTTTPTNTETKPEETTKPTEPTKPTETPTDTQPVKLSAGGNIKKAVGKGQPNEPNDVFKIQTLLKALGASCPVTGVYDADTEKAIGKVTSDFIISPKGPTMAKLLLGTLPKLGKPADVEAKTSKIVEQPGCVPNNQPNIPQQIVVAASAGATASMPVLVLIGGMHGCSGQFMVERTPSSIFGKAVVIGAGYNAVWKQIEAAYQAKLGVTTPLPMSACSVCGFSKGGETVQGWGVGKFKKVGLIDPVTSVGWAKGFSSKVILSCNFTDWARTNSALVVSTATEKGATVEETRVGHMKYVEYFLSQFGGDLV